MPRSHEITKAKFDILLRWLDPSRERAGEKYETIRQSLIQVFLWRGCSDAEDLADETINRVANKVEDVAETYVGDPARYFYGVANMLVKEVRKAQPQSAPLAEAMSLPDESVWRDHADPENEHYLEALNRCINKLSEADQNLILTYYQWRGQARIDNRKKLATELNLPPVFLRMRVHRIRLRLKKCIKEELARLYEDEGKHSAEERDTE